MRCYFAVIDYECTPCLNSRHAYYCMPHNSQYDGTTIRRDLQSYMGIWTYTKTNTQRFHSVIFQWKIIKTHEKLFRQKIFFKRRPLDIVPDILPEKLPPFCLTKFPWMKFLQTSPKHSQTFLHAEILPLYASWASLLMGILLLSVC